jgi:hypothetical protein
VEADNVEVVEEQENLIPEQVAEEVPSAEEEDSPALLPGLTPVHTGFLRLLLDGGDWRGFVADRHLMLALLVDEVNEAFYEEIGDTVLEFDGAEPVPVEDYIEDLKGYLD